MFGDPCVTPGRTGTGIGQQLNVALPATVLNALLVSSDGRQLTLAALR